MPTSPKSFFVNSRATVNAVFTLDDTETDPTTVSAEIIAPSGAVSVVNYPDASLTKTRTGNFQLSVDCTQVGVWSVAWSSTGTVQAVDVVRFVVKPKT